ncbi:MAG TPA: DUF459 domain-containing protein, partial [Nannocystaceae bacterium]|nr:DUF459 domain-containing protein [Nannocystaceae bacterium]
GHRSAMHRLTRRAFSVGTGCLVLGGARTARAADGPKILVVGDSMIAGGFGVFLERALEKEYALPVLRKGKSSSGLARPDFHDWPEAAAAIVEGWKPAASVVMFGGNDVQGLYMGKGEWIRWNDDGWDEEYARRVDAFCEIIAPAGERIFWVGMPVMRPAKFHARVQRVNVIYRARMAARPGALFVDAWDVLADDNGAYADKIAIGTKADGTPGKKVRVRAGDGIHLSPAGANVLRDHVLAVLEKELAITKTAT